MLVAPKRQEEPFWKPVMGAQVLFEPITRAMFRSARRAVMQKIGEAPDGEMSIERIEELGDALSEALILAGARDWRDVETDGEDGSPVALPFTRENLETVLSDPIFFEAFDDAYAKPFLLREREKNGSAASLNTTSGTATAEQTIAGSAVPVGTEAGVKPARTRKTRSPRPKRKTSSKS
jgi:hypothetical protein